MTLGGHVAGLCNFDSNEVRDPTPVPTVRPATIAKSIRWSHIMRTSLFSPNAQWKARPFMVIIFASHAAN